VIGCHLSLTVARLFRKSANGAQSSRRSIDQKRPCSQIRSCRDWWCTARRRGFQRRRLRRRLVPAVWFQRLPCFSLLLLCCRARPSLHFLVFRVNYSFWAINWRRHCDPPTYVRLDCNNILLVRIELDLSTLSNAVVTLPYSITRFPLNLLVALRRPPQCSFDLRLDSHSSPSWLSYASSQYCNSRHGPAQAFTNNFHSFTTHRPILLPVQKAARASAQTAP
jgi:hypothetical protein